MAAMATPMTAIPALKPAVDVTDFDCDTGAGVEVELVLADACAVFVDTVFVVVDIALPVLVALPVALPLAIVLLNPPFSQLPKLS